MTGLTSAVNVQVDSQTKKEATDILNKLGISMSMLINATLKQVVINQGVPFELTLNKKPNREMIQALKEAKKIANTPDKYKGYHNIDEMFEDILNED